jgi:hypothetical protein
MSTLMSTGNNSGQTGRCDAKCYNAKGPECKCCCGGRNHGAGIEQAIQNIDDYAHEILKARKRKKRPETMLVIENLLF